MRKEAKQFCKCRILSWSLAVGLGKLPQGINPSGRIYASTVNHPEETYLILSQGLQIILMLQVVFKQIFIVRDDVSKRFPSLLKTIGSSFSASLKIFCVTYPHLKTVSITSLTGYFSSATVSFFPPFKELKIFRNFFLNFVLLGLKNVL